MLGGLMGAQTSSKDFGQQLLNSVARQAIQQLFSESEAVDVKINCSPASKILQGIVDSFRMEGRGLVIRRAFRAKEMMFETDAVSLDMGSALAGKIRLRQPTQAIATVVLAEDAITDAFRADLVQQRLEGVTCPELAEVAGGEAISFQDVRLQLLPQQQVKLQAQAQLPDRQVPISCVTKLTVEKRRRLLFSEATFEAADVPADCHALSEQLMVGFVATLNDMVDLDRFNLDGVTLRINRLETQQQQLVFSGYAQIDHFPGMG